MGFIFLNLFVSLELEAKLMISTTVIADKLLQQGFRYHKKNYVT